MVGSLRVTHPSASLIVSEDTFSLDLHVLGTPPAFILSQDQTLRRVELLITERDPAHGLFRSAADQTFGIATLVTHARVTSRGRKDVVPPVVGPPNLST